jgi:hypothetical protein
VLAVYSDDSTCHSGEKRLVVAGYILSAEAWKEFNADWAEALAASNPRPLKWLHMTTSFYGWLPAQRLEKLECLAEVIRKHKPLSMQTSVSTRDFKQLLAPVVPYDIRHPYFACFFAIVSQSAKLAGLFGLTGPLDYVFDKQGRPGDDAASLYELMKQLQPEDIKSLMGGPPQFLDDEEVLPLQAADMLAWHRRAIMEVSPTDDQRRLADSIVFEGRHLLFDIPREVLQSWAEGFAKMPGIADVQSKRGSVRREIAHLIGSVPPDRIVPIMKELDRRARRLRWLRTLLRMIGLRKLWKKIAKRASIVVR